MIGRDRLRQAGLDTLLVFTALAAPIVNQARFTEAPLTSEPVFNLLALTFLAGIAFALIAPPRTGLWRVVVLTMVMLFFVDGSVGLHSLVDQAARWFGHMAGLGVSVTATVVAALALAAVTSNREWVLVAFFGATLLSSALLGAPSLSQGQAPPPRPDWPVILHLVLDGMQGPETLAPGIPGERETRQGLRAFADDLGFRVHGNARATDWHTQTSLSRTFNFDPGTPDPGLYLEGLRVARNAWFDRLRQAGYHVEVFQRGRPDFCAHPAVSYCRTYHSRGNIAYLRELSAAQPSLTKRLLIHAQFFSHPRSVSFWALQFLQVGWFSTGTEAARPFEALSILDEALARARQAPPATAVFGHILLPHYPYGLDRTCHIVTKSQDDWLGEVHLLDDQSRSKAWAAYYEQARCLIGTLHRALADPAFDDVMVLLHGDHGSRHVISPRDWESERARRLDHPDLYSTFFAFRMPQEAGGYDGNESSLPALFKTVAGKLLAPAESSTDGTAIIIK